MPTIAITGIGGFIGLAMAERALAMGWQVQGLDLSAAGAQRAQALGATTVLGSVNDASAVAQAFAGADYVFHTAAIVAEDGDRALYDRVNIEGTRCVAQGAVAAGVTTLVHLSSVMAYGFDYPPDVSEDGPLAGNGNPYNETKRLSEDAAMSCNGQASLGVIVIRPGDVYGVGSVPWVLRPIELLIKRQFALPDGGKGVINHVHVQNLIDGVLLALHAKAYGQVFNISDGIATPTREFFAPHARIAQRQLICLPGWVLHGAMNVTANIYRGLGKTPPANAAAIYFLQRKHRYSINKAQTQLGYIPKITLAAGMAELEKYYRDSQSA